MSETTPGVVSISVGNLAMGGRGKTPVAMHLARLLAAGGERPAVLSRGYGRRIVEDGVVVVSDGRSVRADLDRSGDEPMLVALSVPDAAVLVCDERAIAAVFAREILGATACVLDDGFQHRAVARHVDLVIVRVEDLGGRRVPFGRLREPVSALARASVVVIDGPIPEGFERTRPDVLRDKPLFSLRRSLGDPVPLEVSRPRLPLPGPVVAMAGIAEPDRFLDALRRAGWPVADFLPFPDHHRYRPSDLDKVARAAERAGADAVVTTEKDAIRLLPLRPLPVPVAAIPLDAAIEPADEFRSWLFARVAEARR